MWVPSCPDCADKAFHGQHSACSLNGLLHLFAGRSSARTGLSTFSDRSPVHSTALKPVDGRSLSKDKTRHSSYMGLLGELVRHVMMPVLWAGPAGVSSRHPNAWRHYAISGLLGNLKLLCADKAMIDGVSQRQRHRMTTSRLSTTDHRTVPTRLKYASSFAPV